MPRNRERLRLERITLALGLLVMAGCATVPPRKTVAETIARRDPASGTLRLTVPPPPPRPRAEVSNERFALTLVQLSRDLHAPRHAAPGRLIRASFFESDERDPELIHGRELLVGYDRWCAAREGPSDCLGVLDGHAPTMKTKRRLGLSLGLWPVWGGVVNEVGGMVNLPTLIGLVSTALVGYVVLWALPEPASKIFAAVLTAALWGYLGSELIDIAAAYIHLQDEVDAATSFEQVLAASERFGAAVGPRLGRMLVMAAMAMLGSDARIPERLQRLPGFEVAVRQGGFRNGAAFLELLGSVREATYAEGALTLALPGGAVAMSLIRDAVGPVDPNPRELVRPERGWEPPDPPPSEEEIVAEKVAEAEATDVGDRVEADLAELERNAPTLERPPEGVEVGDERWGEYVRYRARRLAELKNPPPGKEVKKPLRWRAYQRMREDVQRGLDFQKQKVHKLLQAEAEQAAGERSLLGRFREPRIEQNVGVRKPGSTRVRYADHVVIEKSPVPGEELRIETFSEKSRNLRAMTDKEWKAQMKADAQDALDGYGGVLDIRRPSLKMRAQPVRVSKVHLVYDADFTPTEAEKLALAISEIQTELGVEVSFR